MKRALVLLVGLAVLATACLAGASRVETASGAQKLGPIRTVRPDPAHILSVKMVVFRRPDPLVKHNRIDIFAVTVRNDGDKNFVRAILLAGKNGTPTDWPVIIDGTDNLKFVAAKPPVWQVPLAPLKTKVIYFVARSTDDNSYCAGINDAVWQCTS